MARLALTARAARGVAGADPVYPSGPGVLAVAVGRAVTAARIDRSLLGRAGEPVTMHIERGKIPEFARAIRHGAASA